MAGEANAVPPAVDLTAVNKQLADLSAQLAGLTGVVDQVKGLSGLADQVKALQDGQKAIQDAAGKGLSPEAVQKLVGEQLAALREAEAEAVKAGQASAELKAKREKFAAESLKGVPASYHGKLGDDEAKWADEAKAVRESFAAEAKAAGLKVPDLGGAAGGEAVAAPASGAGFLKMPG